MQASERNGQWSESEKVIVLNCSVAEKKRGALRASRRLKGASRMKLRMRLRLSLRALISRLVHLEAVRRGYYDVHYLQE